MWEYFLVLIATIFFPLILSFEKRVTYYKKLPAFFGSFIVVGIPLIIWDIFATLRGDWSFNKIYVSGISFFGLPLEEILFFLIIPYSCLLIYEFNCIYISEKKFSIPKNVPRIGALLSFFGSFVFFSRPYTSTVLASLGILFVVFNFKFKGFLISKRYWVYISASTVLFFLGNSILTGLPIVIYGPDNFIGIRIGTIPIEDFIYNYVMLSFYLLAYLNFKKRLEL